MINGSATPESRLRLRNNGHAHRAIYRVGFVLTCLGTVLGQLHALARFSTPEGREDLELPLTRAWAEPAAQLLRPLLDWADPFTVYVAYGRMWVPVFAAAALCGLVVYWRRCPSGNERIAWWLTLGSLGLVTLIVAGEYFTPWLEQFFMIGVPCMLALFGSATLLGVMLIKNRSVSRVSAWVLASMIPLALLIIQVTSLGNAFLPLLWAFVIGARATLKTAAPSEIAGVGDRAVQTTSAAGHR